MGDATLFAHNGINKVTTIDTNLNPSSTGGPIQIETVELFIDIDLAEYVTDIDGDNPTFEVISSAQHGTTALFLAT